MDVRSSKADDSEVAGRSQSSAGVLEKVGAVLDLLAVEIVMSSSQIADQIDEPRSSVYRLLRTMQDQGLVEPGGSRGTYQLGIKLFLLGSRVAQRFDGRELGRPIMKNVHELTGQTVFLCVRKSMTALCVERIDGKWVQSLVLNVGTILPLHVGGASKALLAFLDREVWIEYVQNPTEMDLPLNPVLETAPFLAELERIREQGYAVSDQDLVPGIAALGVPVFDHRGEVYGSISISGIRDAILGDDRERNVTLLRDAANELSTALGFLPGEDALR